MSKKYHKTVAALVALAAAAVLLSMPAALLARYIHTSNDVSAEFVPGRYQTLTINREDGRDQQNGFYSLSLLSVTTEPLIYPVYVRVMIDITWQNELGQIYGQQPRPGTDFSLSFNDEDWFCDLNDGKYYCYTDVPVGGTTEPLIGKTETQKLVQLREAPAEGYSLKVEISAQAVQAVGQTEEKIPAVEDAWGEHPRPDRRKGGRADTDKSADKPWELIPPHD